MIHFKVGDEVINIHTLKKGVVTEIIKQSWPDSHSPFNTLPDLYRIEFLDETFEVASPWTYDLLEPEPNDILKALV